MKATFLSLPAVLSMAVTLAQSPRGTPSAVRRDLLTVLISPEKPVSRVEIKGGRGRNCPRVVISS